MKYIIISVFTLLTLLLLQSCQSKCRVGCSFQLDVASVGYAVDELDTVIITYYTPDNTFTTVTGSHLFDFSNPLSYLPYWQSVGIDTLACNGLILFNGGGTIPATTTNALQLGNIAPGMYLLQVSDYAGRIFKFKFVVE